jgi:SecD/SecF fusion protein
VRGALSQAVEVLRKRVDRFGVAEPVIQSAGGNRILIQLPGLSPSDKESAQSFKSENGVSRIPHGEG